MKLNNSKQIVRSICMSALLLVVLLTTINCSEQRVDGVRKGSIKGVVVEKGTNAPVVNVKITTNPSSNTVFTDEKGNFVLKDVLVDKYTIQAELTGYNEAFESVNVIEDQEITVAFELTDKESLNDPPSTPRLVYPKDKSKIALDSVAITFKWQCKDPDLKDKLTYELELRNSKTNEVELFKELTDTFYAVKNLKYASTYFWEVRAKDKINAAVNSEIMEVTTEDYPDNPIVFVKKEAGNTVIYSGKQAVNTSGDEPQVDIDLLKLTSADANCFKPRRSKNASSNKIAYLRSVGGNTQIFTMDANGGNEKQITSAIPVNGFRLDAVDFCWANNGSYLYYPNFDKLYRVNRDGTGTQLMYQTPDGSFISEVKSPEFNSNLVVIKTNDFAGYNVRIVTVNLSTKTEQEVIVENTKGAFGSLDITASGNKVLYTRDIDESENSNYRIFKSRAFIYDLTTKLATPIDTDTDNGYNVLEAKFTPSEGAIVYTKVLNYFGADPKVYKMPLNGNSSDNEVELFTSASMPDWEK